MRSFLCVLVALVCLAVATPAASACNGVQAVVVQPFVVQPVAFVQTAAIVQPVSTFFQPVQAVTFVQPFIAVQAVQVQRVQVQRVNVFRSNVTEVRSFTGPLGLFNRTVIRQR